MMQLWRYVVAIAGGVAAAVLIATVGMIPFTVVVGIVGAWLRGPRDIQGPAGLMLSVPLGIMIGGLYVVLKCSAHTGYQRGAAWIAWGTIVALLVASLAILGLLIARSG